MGGLQIFLWQSLKGNTVRVRVREEGQDLPGLFTGLEQRAVMAGRKVSAEAGALVSSGDPNPAASLDQQPPPSPQQDVTRAQPAESGGLVQARDEPPSLKASPSPSDAPSGAARALEGGEAPAVPDGVHPLADPDGALPQDRAVREPQPSNLLLVRGLEDQLRRTGGELSPEYFASLPPALQSSVPTIRASLGLAGEGGGQALDQPENVGGRVRVRHPQSFL